MIHFLAQIESFCSLEAIELAWEDFLVFVKARQGDLDALIGAHRAYLKTIVSRALLLHKKEMGEESLLKVLQDALGLVMTFATLSVSRQVSSSPLRMWLISSSSTGIRLSPGPCRGTKVGSTTGCGKGES